MPPAASENFLNHIRDIYLADSPHNDPVNLTKIPATCDAIDRVISREVYLAQLLCLATSTDKTQNLK